MSSSKSQQQDSVVEGKVYAILAYLSILCIIPLVLKKDNEFVLFHGKQGLIIFLGEVAVFILHIIMEWVFRPGMFVFGVVSFAGIIMVLKGEKWEIPGISTLSDQITL